MVVAGVQVGVGLGGFRERVGAPDRDGEVAAGQQRGQLGQRLGGPVRRVLRR